MTLPLQADPPLRLLTAFQELYPNLSPQHIVQAPGREMWVAATPSDLQVFTIHAPDLNGRTAFNWRSAKQKQTILHRPLPRWSRYPAGVIVTLYANGMDTAGIEAVVLGEETAGPRYDHTLGMVFAALWHVLHNQPYTGESLLEIVERARREYVEG